MSTRIDHRPLRPMTPDEYADAYAYWTEQDSRRRRREVEDLLDERTFRFRADVVRVTAQRTHRDTPEITLCRRAHLADATRRLP